MIDIIFQLSLTDDRRADSQFSRSQRASQWNCRHLFSRRALILNVSTLKHSELVLSDDSESGSESYHESTDY